MEINNDTKEIINLASNGAFPQKGHYFYVSYKGNDNSWRDDVFKCTGTDPFLVVAISPTERVVNRPFRFTRKEWDFHQVSEEVLNAIGICVATDNISDVEIIS